ncbi:MAG: hypothetical protein HC799_14510 [Limnothrix sp. RL_2_0]|nr:hypothetical protein [Limnothrix sp. RL_2_0]
MLTSLNSTLAIAPAIEQQFLTGTMEMTLAAALNEVVRLRSHCDLLGHGKKNPLPPVVWWWCRVENYAAHLQKET